MYKNTNYHFLMNKLPLPMNMPSGHLGQAQRSSYSPSRAPMKCPPVFAGLEYVSGAHLGGYLRLGCNRMYSDIYIYNHIYNYIYSYIYI